MQFIRIGIFLLSLCYALHSQAQQWTSLMWDDLLKDWTVRGGLSTFTAKDGVITAHCIDNSQNTFLCTNAEYQDFILEFEILVDSALNSGVQIRSHSSPGYQNGRVHGLQVEVDPGPRKFSGGIYDEGRRLWLYPTSLNPHCRSAFRNGIWNSFRVEATGNRIRTLVNGVPCANLVDEFSESGFIALQAHAVYHDADIGKTVQWRNIRIMTSDIERYLTPTIAPEQSYLVNQLTPIEKAMGWKLLWDGNTTNGWRGARSEQFPDHGWVIRDGNLTIEGTSGRESAGPGDIITRDQYANFILELEFMITAGANSGIKYFVDPELNKNAGSAIGCEFQILDDQNHPDAKLGVNGNRTLASLYDLITAENYSLPGRSKQFKGINQWNKAMIISKNGRVEHWLNNEKVLEYDRFSHMFRALVAYSKYKQWPGFGQWPKGHILLQDHGHTVHFRSIKILEL
ncbi:MAG TPA: DUF1080 domain-containing protein [Saprospiraceae bacterium]|nr:DUF1080 domain-containing protein [Saprospiraceae bacterium]